jgi:hypothetical protein
MFFNLIACLPAQELLPGGTMPLRIDYRRRPNARRYILRVNERGDGGCVTVPRSGSLAEARRFAQRNAAWLEQRLRQHRERASRIEDKILFRGELLPLAEIFAKCSGDAIPTSLQAEPTSAVIEAHPLAIMRARVQTLLRRCAERELPPRTHELAATHGLTVRRVSVRNQRSRWGSCSVKGVVSLNWRLVQAPEFVRDYIIVHELMHLREMNHSARFWKHVHAAFPRTDEAERWLKTHGNLLRAG